MSLFKSLVRYNVSRTRLADEAQARAVLAPGEARKISKLGADGIVDEVMRRALVAALAGLPEQKRVIKAQIVDEVAALKVETPTTLRALTEVDIDEEKAAQAAVK